MTGFSHDDVQRNAKLWEERLHPEDAEGVTLVHERVERHEHGQRVARP